MTEEKKYFKRLKETYPFKERYQNLLAQIQDVLEALQIMDYVNINTDLLGQAVLDYFEDIDKLKVYEKIDRTNVDKIYSYETYWLLKRKPIQITDDNIDFKYIHINEKVCLFILMAKMLKEAGKDYNDSNSKMHPFIDLLFYNFKYRQFTQKSLELMVSAFICGCSFNN